MENTLDKDHLNEVFVDVRKAYRLLYLYQRRVMDLVQFIGNHYQFSYVRGWSEFSSSRGATKLKLGNWAWDMLGMYCITFQFSTKNYKTYKNVEFGVVIISDTGYYDKSNREAKRLMPDTFEEVSNAQTQLHLILKTKDKDWKGYKDELFKSDSPTTYTKKNDNPTDFLIGKKYDLADFMNEESTLEQLKDFTAFCTDNGIDIKSTTV